MDNENEWPDLFQVKRETGENPVRCRHCKGEFSSIRPLAPKAGKAEENDEPKPVDLLVSFSHWTYAHRGCLTKREVCFACH